MRDRKASLELMAAAGLTVLGVSMYMLEPIYVGAVADRFGFSSRQLGFLVAAEIGATLAVSLTAALWITTARLRRVALLAVASTLAGNLLTPFCESYALLLGCRMLTAFFGSGLAYTLGMRELAATRSPERAYGFSILAQVSYGALGLALLPAAIAAAGFAVLPLAWAGLAALLLPLLRYLPERVGPTAASAQPAGVSLARAGIVMLAVLVIWNTALGGLWAFMERIGRGMELATDAVGMALAAGMLIGILGSALATWLGDRFGIRWQVYGMLAAHLFVVYELSGQHGAVGFALLVALLNFSWNLANPYLLAAVARRDPSGRLVVLIPACQTIGTMLGPAIAGLLVIGNDFGGVLWFAAGCYLLMTLCLLPVYRQAPAATEEKLPSAEPVGRR